jgi:uncharacterized protein
MEWILAGLGLMLILEGLMPLVSPAAWRRTFQKLLEFQDGQLRFIGLFSVLVGLVVLWFAGLE